MLNCDEIDPLQLDQFLHRCFPEQKADSLKCHGFWRHKGNNNRFVVVSESGEFAGYFGIILIDVVVKKAVHTVAIWWIDLFVLPEYRGHGVQSITDDTIRKLSDLFLGFPNHIAAKIHKKHGWGVRNDLQIRMLPLIPLQVPHLNRFTGIRRIILKFAALLLSPLATIYKRVIIYKKSN